MKPNYDDDSLLWLLFHAPVSAHTPACVILSIFTIFTNIIQILERNTPKHNKYYYPS